MTQTPNYKLTQWAKTDRIEMEDFNGDNAKLDNALKAHDTAIAARATTAALNAETAARKQAIAAEASARTSAVNALNAAVAKLGNCQLYYTTYTVTGSISVENPVTFTFPHKPMLVCVGDGATRKFWAVQGMPQYYEDSYEAYRLTWSGNSFSYFGSNGFLNSGPVYVLALLDASK